MIFLVKHCDINFQTCEKNTPISHMYHTYAKLLKLTEVGIYTLISC